MNTGIYIHIPFCKSKCHYCDFKTLINVDKYIDRYIEDLIKEINLYLNDKITIDSIYIGGGTPGYLDSKYIINLFDCLSKYNMAKNCEITIEINPENATDKNLSTYKNLGVNRISMGTQTFDNEVLKKIGRNHDAKTALDAFDQLVRYGFDNINLDMMLNLPGQTEESINRDLSILEELSPSHLSYYSLILEEKTYFYHLYKNNKLDLMDSDLEIYYFEKILKKLESLGYDRYEISNFSKKGYQSKHNMKYWRLFDYLGFGISAASNVGLLRWSNTQSINEYHKKLSSSLKPVAYEERLSLKDRYKEYIIMNLRLKRGLIFEESYKRFNINLYEKYREIFDKYFEKGYFIKDEKSIHFTQKGFDLSNTFYVEII